MTLPSRSPVLAVAFAALLVTSGCTALSLGFGDTGPPTADVVERHDAIRSVEATQVSTLTSGNNTTHSRTRIRLDLVGVRRQSSLQLAPSSQAGDRVVVNESVMVVYDASENTVTRIPRIDRLTNQSRASYLGRIVEAARDDGEVVKPAGDVSPLPVVPATSAEPSVPAGAIEGYRVEYIGTETVAGRTAHGFRMTAVSEAALDLNQTLWLDAEFYYPLRTDQTFSVGNTTMRVTSHLRNVTFNGDLPDEAFEFDPPANATVNTTDLPEMETYDSVSALEENTAASVPNPSIPDGYHFEQARSTSGNVSRVSLRYASGDGTLSVSKMASVSNATGPSTVGENVTVAGHDGSYVTFGASSVVTWTCGGHSYSVVATVLEREQLLDVAASVACE